MSDALIAGMNPDPSLQSPDYSLVIPVFNEIEVLPELFPRLVELMDALDGPCEVILVDDGSSDGSYAACEALHERDARFKLIQFSRNFGHQAAITAGMDIAAGRAVVIMDADLQDPPEVVLEMAKRWREGYEVVYGVREKRMGESLFKRVTASIFYSILSRLSDIQIPRNVGDFRLVDRRALDAFKSLPESNRYVRGLFAWVGFKQIGVPYERDPRTLGTTHYPLRRMMRLAIDGIAGFSHAPLRLALNLGFIFSGIAVFGGILAVILRVMGVWSEPGWTSIIVIVTFLGGVQLMVLGVMGEYLARTFDEAKRRPIYLIRESKGFGVNERDTVLTDA